MPSVVARWPLDSLPPGGLAGRGFDIWLCRGWVGGLPERVTSGGGFRGFEAADGKSFFYARRDDYLPLFNQPIAGGPARPQVADCVLNAQPRAGGP